MVCISYHTLHCEVFWLDHSQLTPRSNPATITTITTITNTTLQVDVLNQIGVHVACVGNHDLDFGLEHLLTSARQCTFPWLMANVADPLTGQPIFPPTAMLQHEGLHVGVMGLVEEEWLGSLATMKPSEFVYRDYVEVAKELVE